MIVLNHTKQFFMQAGSNLNVLSTLYFSPQSILPLCTLESLNYECRSATLNFCKHFYSIVYYSIQHNQSMPTQSNQFHKIIFCCGKHSSSPLCPLPPFSFPPFIPPFFFFLGRLLIYCSKGTFPVSSTSPFRKGVCVQPVPFVIMNFGQSLLELWLSILLRF